MTAENLVVEDGDGMDRIRQIVQRICQSLLYPFAMIAVENSNLGVKRCSVGSDQYVALSVPAHNQVCLKVTWTYQISQDIRPLLDGDTNRNRSSGILEPATLAAPANMLQEAMNSMIGQFMAFWLR